MNKNSVATIYDVAGSARVSMATVSRVLNTPDKVNAATREKVLKIVNELGYIPNPIARDLATKKATTNLLNMKIRMAKLSSLFTYSLFRSYIHI